eukprot:CAMPEP_0170635370 /NCGR_PEP_ID=MMETSP0224-20130122/37174_1 /TAXON_ID=285029 /ORGANISM="Togula jolla, Strain CCCM 725" /LENGTH=42 /DNA_ID= /DNA_START= /DNA_END= /DNA_ORIENTATION=
MSIAAAADKQSEIPGEHLQKYPAEQIEQNATGGEMMMTTTEQ